MNTQSHLFPFSDLVLFAHLIESSIIFGGGRKKNISAPFESPPPGAAVTAATATSLFPEPESPENKTI
jgi:hypothetical protein